MLHNTGPFGPNDVPVNHPNTVNMSPLSGHINMPHHINNLSKSGQQSVQTASGHYNLPEYTGYSHVPLNMSPQISHVPTYPQIALHDHYMPQNSTPANDMSWQNGMLPMNLNVQHEHNMNIMNYHNNYDKRSLESIHDHYKETPIRKVPLNIPQIPIKTIQRHINPDNNYSYTDNYKYPNHNLDLSMKPQEKIQLDSTRRKNIENTVRLIENILINSTKNKDEGNSYVNNKNLDTTEPSNVYNTKVGYMPQTSNTYGSKLVSTSETHIYGNKLGSTSESSNLTTKIGSMPQTSIIYGNKPVTSTEGANKYSSKIGSTSESNNLTSKIESISQRSNIYSSKPISSLETNMYGTKFGSTIESNNLTTKIGSMPQTSIIYGSKPMTTTENSNISSTNEGSTSESNKLITKGGSMPQTSNIYSKTTIATSETPNVSNTKGSTPDSSILNFKVGSTNLNIYSEVIPTSEATNVFIKTKSTSHFNQYNDKKTTPTTNITSPETNSVNVKTELKSPNVTTETNDKPDQKWENNNDQSSDEESSSDNDEKPSIEERDLKEVVIESKIEIKVENTNCIDMDYFQPFLRDCNGAQRDDVDSKIIDGEISVEEASAAIKNEISLNGYYECPHCTLLFNNAKRFLIHTKWHTFGLTYEKRMEVVREREQRKQANREAKVVERMRAREVTDVPTDGKVFPCKDCDKVFSAKGSLKNHRKRTHPTRSRDCKICRKTIIGWSAMRAHVATHSCGNSGGYQCMECPKRFKYSHSLAKHKDTHLEKTHGCSDCPKMFGSQALLKMHMKTHERVQKGTTFRCTYCGKGFYECYSLQVHERTHRNERPFTCDICSTSFGTNSSLKRHIKVSHSTSKPHECSICHRSFSTERIRDRHEVRVHSQPEDFKFPCKQCSCKYLKLKDLQKHVYKVHPKNKRRKKAQSDSE